MDILRWPWTSWVDNMHSNNLTSMEICGWVTKDNQICPRQYLQKAGSSLKYKRCHAKSPSHRKRSGSTLPLVSGGFNTTRVIGMIFLIDWAISQPPNKPKPCCAMFSEFLCVAIEPNIFPFCPQLTQLTCSFVALNFLRNNSTQFKTNMNTSMKSLNTQKQGIEQAWCSPTRGFGDPEYLSKSLFMCSTR